MKKVLHLLAMGSYSGAENVVCQIIDMYRNDDEYEMVYCSPNGKIKDVLEEKGINYLPLESMSLSKIKKVINKYNPDIIHAHDKRASLMAALVCKNRLLISHMHCNFASSRKISLNSLGYMFAAVKAKKILWVSKSSYEDFYFKNCIKKKSLVLYNVIDINKLIEKRDRDHECYNYDVVYVGRLAYAKNPYRLIDVLKLAVDKIPNLKVAIIGNGQLEQDISNYISQLNLNNNIKMLGFKDNPYKIVSDAKLMLMTSLFEGTPMCAIEALSLGTVIVSTPTDGLKDLIQNGYNGYISDNNEKLAEYICKLYMNENLLNEMSINAKKFAEKYNCLEKYKSELDQIYGMRI